MTDKTNTDQGTPEIDDPYAEYPTDPSLAGKLAVEAIVRAKHPQYFSALMGGPANLGGVQSPMCVQTSRPELHRFNEEQSLAYYKAVADTSKKQIVDLSSRLRTLTRWVMAVVGVGVVAAFVGLAIFGMTR